MISSEVQRTLVKSPPELWTELSDPDSLARHLGALGQVRITRAEAEKRVDWEADGASGSITIKPSGWGTKVTLSATREVTVPEADAVGEAPAAAPEADSPPDADADPEAPQASEPDATGETDRLPDAVEDVEADVALVPDASETPETPEGPVADVAPDAAVADEADEAPEAENRLAPEDAFEVGTSFKIAEGFDADDSFAAEGFSAVDEVPQPEMEPRRGFLARLFGLGRRRSVTVQPAETDFEPAAFEPADLEPEPAAEADFAPEPEADVELAPQPEAAAEPETAADSPEPAEPGGTAIESLQARYLPDAAKPQDAAPVLKDASDAESGASNGDELAGQPVVDLAAELAAAEEVAVEEVTAVLTAVLDRLGAAHHRPFSRS